MDQSNDPLISSFHPQNQRGTTDVRHSLKSRKWSLHELESLIRRITQFKITGYAHLDGLEPGGVVVGELLEDVSRSEAERTQAMQDGSFKA